MLSTSKASPLGPSIRSPQVLARLLGRVELKSSNLLSGDQRGFELAMLGEVIRIGAPPAVAAIQTSE